MKRNQPWCHGEYNRLRWVMQSCCGSSMSSAKVAPHTMHAITQLCSAIRGCELQTIQESTFLDALTYDQERKFDGALEALIQQPTMGLYRGIVTFRGVSHKHLEEKLSKKKRPTERGKTSLIVILLRG